MYFPVVRKMRSHNISSVLNCTVQ